MIMKMLGKHLIKMIEKLITVSQLLLNPVDLHTAEGRKEAELLFMPDTSNMEELYEIQLDGENVGIISLRKDATPHVWDLEYYDRIVDWSPENSQFATLGAALRSAAELFTEHL